MADPNDNESLKRLVTEQSVELEALHRILADFHAASKKFLTLLSQAQDETTLAQEGIEVLATLIQARYGAVGLLDDDGNLRQFLYTGLTQQEREHIATLPKGKGLLGTVINENQVMRLENLNQDSRAVGFPAHHPKMNTLLAAPISRGKRVYGRIYLSDKYDGSFFNALDEQLVTTFANTFALALYNAETINLQQQTEHLAAKIIENTKEGVIVTNTAFIIQSINPAFCQISGYQPEEIIGQSIRQFHCEERCSSIYEQIISTLESDDHWQGELWYIRKNGELYPNSSTIFQIKEENNKTTRYVIICRDITVQKQFEEKLDYLAHHDVLTGLPNRLLFKDRLEQKISYARRHNHSIALMFLDLDLFKLVNDSLGHEIGDVLLQSVAQRLQHCVRESDTVARLGGDEFTIILDNAGIAEANTIAHKIRLAMSHIFKFYEHELHITISIGIGLFPQDGEDVITLVKNADIAMYHAKDIGNTHCFFTGAMKIETGEQLMIEDQLYTALENEELRLTFQPKLNISTEKIVGTKVFLRWEHPYLGLVKPRSFIPLAEHTGLIIPIGWWVLRTACHQCKFWQKKGLTTNLRITVTLSARQFSSDDLITMVSTALDETELSPNCLELEVSEIAIINKPQEAVKKLKQLKVLGVGIIVTDIGSENIFCNTKQQCAADTLRINGSLTSADNRANSDLTESLISKAHGLKLRVVAEGVETEAQLDFLRSKQCDEVLGHYFSRPVSAVEFERLLSIDGD